MGVSTHRFIAMFILINICIGLALTIYTDPTTVTTTVFTESIDEQEQYEQDIQTDEGIYGTVKSSADRQQEAHVGNPLIWGWRILKLFIYSLYPFGLIHFTYSTTIELFIAIIITLFRTIVMSMAIVEGYMLFINKKQN